MPFTEQTITSEPMAVSRIEGESYGQGGYGASTYDDIEFTEQTISAE